MDRRLPAAACAGILLLLSQPALASDRQSSVEAEIARLADDYARDPMLRSGVFGIRVDGETWTVSARRATSDEPASVTVTPGEPTTPAFIFETDADSFDRIRRGEVTAYTSMAKAFDTDAAPMEIRFTDGAQPNAELFEAIRSVAFHFWTTGAPEILQLGFDQSRTVHGGQGTIGYYAPGIRTGFAGVLPGQHVNSDPRSQKDPWTTIFYVIKGGTTKGRIGEAVIDLQDGTMIFVPPNTRHEFWNPGDQPAEMIMVIFGSEA